MDQLHHTAIQVSILARLELPAGAGHWQSQTQQKGGCEGRDTCSPVRAQLTLCTLDRGAPLCHSGFQQHSDCTCAISRVTLGLPCSKGPELSHSGLQSLFLRAPLPWIYCGDGQSSSTGIILPCTPQGRLCSGTPPSPFWRSPQCPDGTAASPGRAVPAPTPVNPSPSSRC